MIFDTDVLVWRLRDHPGAVEAVGQVPVPERNVSAMSYLELLRGCRDSRELRLLRISLTGHFCEIVSISEDISKSALALMESYALSRRPGLADVLIAATALVRHEALVTANRKHFDFIPGLELRIFRP